MTRRILHIQVSIKVTHHIISNSSLYYSLSPYKYITYKLTCPTIISIYITLPNTVCDSTIHSFTHYCVLLPLNLYKCVHYSHTISENQRMQNCFILRYRITEYVDSICNGRTNIPLIPCSRGEHVVQRLYLQWIRLVALY